jgi:F-type H+-transporting ATPase subunit a
LEFHIAAPTLFTIGPFPVTNTILAAWVSILVLLVLSRAITAKMSVVPGRLQSLGELVVEQFISIGTTTADARRARAFLPIAATGFLFILVSNWMGILPLYGEGELYTNVDDGHGHVIHANLLRSANSDLNITFAMGLIIFLYSEFLGFRTGGLAYAKEFIWPGMLIEVISHLARPIALALRLFGNILAGEILLTVVGSLVGIVIPALFMGFELFVGIVQALIFSLLTLAFLSMSTAHGAHEEHAEHAGAGGAHH